MREAPYLRLVPLEEEEPVEIQAEITARELAIAAALCAAGAALCWTLWKRLK